MKKGIMKFTASLAAILLSTNAFADQIVLGGGGAALDGVFNGIATDGDIDLDVNADQLDNGSGGADGMDSLWAIGGSGGSVTTFIVELAGYASNNPFGIYDASNSSNTVEVFPGGLNTEGDQVTISILLDGSVRLNGIDTGVDFAANVFGYYLDTSAFTGAVWYSQSSLNVDGVDHMIAFQGYGEEIQIDPYFAGIWGANEYILAFDDQYGGGDRDFTDFVVLVESVTPVPAPGTLALLGLGLLGLGAARRRKA